MSGIDDIFARIQLQNSDKDVENASRSSRHGAEARLDYEDHQLRQQLQQAQHGQAHPEVTEHALRSQEHDLDRELELERMRHHGSGRPGVPGGAPAGKLKLTHPVAGKDNTSRSRIPLIPPSARGPGSVAGSVAPSTTPSAALRRPVHFTHAMVKETGTSQMDDFMNPVDGIRGQMRRAGVEPKNHQREQRERINELGEQRKQAASAKEQGEQERARRDAQLRERSRVQVRTG